MAKPLEFFDEFFAAPEKMKAREFYMYVHEWIDYLKEHEGEFNYLEDEEWRERKDRVLEVLNEQQEIKYEREDLMERLEAIEEMETPEEKIEILEEWLAFSKRQQENYEMSDEQLAELEEDVKQAILATLDTVVLEERLKRNIATRQKLLAELDDSLAEHYQRTGRRVVLTALGREFRKRLKGN